MNQHVSPPSPAPEALPEASVTPEPLPATPDPVEIAMAEEKRGPVASDSPVRRLLIDQDRLVRTQIASERMGVALKVLTAFAGLIVAAALAAMVWDASRTEALVVQPFSVPPELVQRGLTGEVAATKLLDGLAELQAETLSNRASGSYANDWGDDVQVEIPQTGVSIGELQDFLRGWLGKELSISGEIVRTATGYQLTTRTGTEAGKSFTGSAEELEKLIKQGSEAVYESTQPERYAAWLVGEKKRDEAIAVYRKLSISGERDRRAWALAEWSQLLSDPTERLERARQALALNPNLPLAHISISTAQKALGHPEQELAADRRTVELLGGRHAEGIAPWKARFDRTNTRAYLAAFLGDPRGAAELYEAAAEPAPDQPPNACELCSASTLLNAAEQYIRAHDRPAAQAALRRAALLKPDWAERAETRQPLYVARAVRDWPVLLRDAEARVREAREALAKASPKEVEEAAPSIARELRPFMAGLYARNGRVSEAQTWIGPTPLDCFACINARALTAAAARDWPSAERWHKEAVRQAPSLPSAYSSWGETRLARGDVEGAIHMFAQAQERGPRWAEPVKLEGDALAQGRQHEKALKRYAAAAEITPRWGALHLAWGRSLTALGRRAEARAKYAQAAKLDLSAADRAAVQALLARPA